MMGLVAAPYANPMMRHNKPHSIVQAVGAAASAMGGGGGESYPQHQQQQQPQGAYQQAPPANACAIDAQNFSACIQQNAGNVDACSFLFEALQSCQRNQQYAGQQM